VAGGELINPTRQLPDHGLEAWKQVMKGDYEGMIAKDAASPYTPRPHAFVAQGEAEGLSSGSPTVQGGLTPPIWLDEHGRATSPTAHASGLSAATASSI
jgi:hypothetical protein